MTDTRTPHPDAESELESTAERADWRTRLQGALSAPGSDAPPQVDARTPVTKLTKGQVAAPASRVSRVSPAPAAPAATPGAVPKQPRRARLRLSRVDPWSVMKTAFLLSIALAVVTVISVLIVWSVLGTAGVWDSINSSVQSVIGGEESKNFDVQNYVGMSRVLGFTMLVAVIDVVLVTAIATLAAFLYNMSAALLGGIELTLSEDGN
jgi:hypothetical protein